MSLENGSDNMCVDCEVRHLKLESKGSVSVVSLKNYGVLYGVLY